MKSILKSKIEAHSVHLWPVFLPDLLARVDFFSSFLNENEKARAGRFRFDQHRARFILARGLLRCIAGFYTGTRPEEIVFGTNDHGKPFLENNPLDIRFNLSHSHDMAIYAFTSGAQMGVDIEMREVQFNVDVARRFFGTQENEKLFALPALERNEAFYRIWVAREALIKMLGEGLYLPLADVVPDFMKTVQTVTILHHHEMQHAHLEYIAIHPDYPCAFATRQVVRECVYQDYKIFLQD